MIPPKKNIFIKFVYYIYILFSAERTFLSISCPHGQGLSTFSPGPGTWHNLIYLGDNKLVCWSMDLLLSFCHFSKLNIKILPPIHLPFQPPSIYLIILKLYQLCHLGIYVNNIKIKQRCQPICKNFINYDTFKFCIKKNQSLLTKHNFISVPFKHSIWGHYDDLVACWHGLKVRNIGVWIKAKSGTTIDNISK